MTRWYPSASASPVHLASESGLTPGPKLSVRGDRRRWSHVYSPDADFVGPLENELASFWKPRLSRLFAATGQTAAHRPAKQQTPQEKARRAKELRSQGRSLSEIANVLGVAKSTVVNYVKGYPYR